MISTHTLRKEGDNHLLKKLAFLAISTHTLRKEGDSGAAVFVTVYEDFNPHPPQGG